MHVAHAERRANASINRLIQMRSHQALDNAGWTVKSSTFLCGFLFFTISVDSTVKVKIKILNETCINAQNTAVTCVLSAVLRYN